MKQIVHHNIVFEHILFHLLNIYSKFYLVQKFIETKKKKSIKFLRLYGKETKRYFNIPFKHLNKE